MKKQDRNTTQNEEKELSYAEKLRRMEDDDRYLAEQRMQQGQKTGCLGMSATFLVGALCLAFLIAGLGFAGYGIANLVNGGKARDIVVQLCVGAGVTVVTVLVWIFYRKHLKE